MNRFPLLAQRIFNVPVAIHAPKAEIIVSALAERLGIAKIQYENETIVTAGNFFYGAGESENEKQSTGYDIKDKVAIIQVHGTLVHKNGNLRPSSGMTGYDGIRRNFIKALEDDSVRAVVFDIDSPGGEVSGCFDLADMIYDCRGHKSMTAILSECAFSAAYAIASACDQITVPRSGGTGSIGVVAVHVDYSRQLEDQGLSVTLIQYGAHKTDAAEVKPLSSEALQKLQADVNKMGDMFVETVARNRGISTKKIREQEANIYMGTAGIEAGLADHLFAPNDAFNVIAETIRKDII